MQKHPFTTLIGLDDLEQLRHARAAPEGIDSVRVIDCRFDLAHPERGRSQFEDGAIPGAIYMHLEEHLSGPIEAGRTGRHPLPSQKAFRDLLAAHGVREGVQLVAYDDSGGIFAARLWWLARWAGHTASAVLDGGFRTWRRPPVGPLRRTGIDAPPAPRTASMEDVREHLGDAARVLLDARDAVRFLGRHEPIDAKAGHIPGALNAPFAGSIGCDGRFLGRRALQVRFEWLLGERIGQHATCYCGSGVSAAHNVLAMVHAGLPEPALYAGSWSEWITDPDNPIA